MGFVIVGPCFVEAGCAETGVPKAGNGTTGDAEVGFAETCGIEAGIV